MRLTYGRLLGLLLATTLAASACSRGEAEAPVGGGGRGADQKPPGGAGGARGGPGGRGGPLPLDDRDDRRREQHRREQESLLEREAPMDPGVALLELCDERRRERMIGTAESRSF